MSDPTPETMSSISRLKSSRMNPIGTCNVPRILIHVSSGAEMSVLVKIAQLQRKLPRTAATEIAALTVLNRRVNSVIAAAEANGSTKTNQGSKVLVVNFKILKS
jgi:hypothetical protein